MIITPYARQRECFPKCGLATITGHSYSSSSEQAKGRNVEDIDTDVPKHPELTVTLKSDKPEIGVAANNKQDNVIIAVSIGDADTEFIRDSVLHAADKYIPPGSVTLVAESAWLSSCSSNVRFQTKRKQQ